MSTTTLEVTPSPDATLSPGSRRPVACVRALRVCGCGQDLETCHAGHCPRCGVTLR